MNDKIFEFVSLENCPSINLDGQDFIDLCSESIFSSKIFDLERVIVVPKSFAGRPHLISRSVYGSENDMDLLFSINGYSNPLTVKAGDFLVVPKIKALRKSASKKSQLNESIVELKKRISVVDENRIKFLKKDESIKTPNMNVSKQQFTVDGRTVSLGSSISPVSGVSEIRKKVLNIKKVKI